MRIFYYILIGLVLLLGITFAILNSSLVTFHYYFGTMQVPLSLILGFTFGIGILLGWLLGLKIILRIKRENRSLRRSLRKRGLG
jgi:putative membrane protein